LETKLRFKSIKASVFINEKLASQIGGLFSNVLVFKEGRNAREGAFRCLTLKGKRGHLFCFV
jgi:hypothetical protein